MKIEMGESLLYSWLRHVKNCQVVQINWKPSLSWKMQNAEEQRELMKISDEYFEKKPYEYDIFRQNEIDQLLLQAEVDVLGISKSDDGTKVYGVDIAFHENGLNYGDQKETVTRVIKKIVRTALCMMGYFGDVKGEIIFASPKVSKRIMDELEPCIKVLNNLFQDRKYQFTAKLIANDDFNNDILKPILTASSSVADTSELFMRGYQLVKMFENGKIPAIKAGAAKVPFKAAGKKLIDGDDPFPDYKVGQIAQKFLRKALESGKANAEEIHHMRKLDYSKEKFGIDFPLLVLDRNESNKVRYYATSFIINKQDYFLCSQWYETKANNDRPLLVKWLKDHDAIP